MLKFIFGKITGKKTQKKPDKSEKIVSGIRHSSGKLFGLLSHKLSEFIEELGFIREKSKNLEKANFNLGRLHLEKGNLRDATFRFYLMTKFFPLNIDAKYELAYCYALREKYTKSQKVLINLLKKNPNSSDKAASLLEHVKKLQQTQ